MLVRTGLACDTQEALIEQISIEGQGNVEGCGMLPGDRPHLTIVTPKFWHQTNEYDLLAAEVMFPLYPAPGIAVYPGFTKWMFLTKIERQGEPA
jgi:hypothetical protein